MPKAKIKKHEPYAISIEGEMTIYRAAELKHMLLNDIVDQQSIEVDLSKVTEIDSAGVQLLILAKKEAQARQHKLSLVSHSTAIVDVFELLNLGAYFGDPLLITRSQV